MALPHDQGESPPRRTSRALIAALLAVAALAGCRLWLADSLPLTDITEARFGEIARKMVETGDWLTPQHDYGVPYLAKPPLAFWLSAAGIELLGASELGPRVLILGAAFGFCALYFACVRSWLGTQAALASVIMLMSSLVFFVSMAAVMTDMVFTVCVATAWLAFWRRHEGGSGASEATMYLALGLGLLAKGPLAAVLFGVPVLAWSLGSGRAADIWRRFAWLKGALLAAAVAVPWYVAAELKNPGFLEYFLVGEHVQRFLVPDWSGDLYGRAHDAPRGTIWLYFIAGALPWSVLCVPALVAARATVRRNWRERRGLVRFALASAVTPLALFTLSRNIVWPYVLPAIPPAVLGVVALLAPAREQALDLSRLAWVGVLSAALLTALVVVNAPFIERHTQRSVVAGVELRHPHREVPIYYWQSRYFSADYYSAGAASVVSDPQPIERALAERRLFCLVVAEARRASLPDALLARLHHVGDIGDFALFEPVYAGS
jgi:4-amino-4-deoxy-L-arabinose transferase-like glycosyltransferase